MVIQRIRQNAAKIIFNDSKEDRETGHNRANPDQDFCPRKSAGQRVNRKFRRETREDNCARNRGFRIGVLHPHMQPRESNLNPHSNQHQPATRTVEANRIKHKVSAIGLRMKNGSGQQHHARENMNGKIANTRRIGVIAALPDQEDRGNRCQFPHDKQRNHIARQDACNRGARINQGGAIGHAAFFMQRINPVNDARQTEEIAPNHGELINA